MEYEPIIGMEVHIELATESKMFCGCAANHFNVSPNIHTCPVCLGLPGALPVPNRKAIRWCVMMGLAFNSSVASLSKFDRKHYFYPDLPKGYQISQYDTPFCSDGHLLIKTSKGEKRVGINRVHMEEDTAKLMHKKVKGEKVSLIDFNRSGVPLVEIVSEPDLHSSEEAVSYLKKIQQIIRYLEVSDCDMEKGSMRCEANISLRKKGEEELPDYRVEVKNLNSFKFVRDATNYELERQKEILKQGKKPRQETRGFNPKKACTFPQRFKEMAHDYRYFPEPDIPPISWSREEVKKIKAELPELPDEKIERFQKEYGVGEYNARILTDTKEAALYFEEAAKAGEKAGVSPGKIAKIIVNKRKDVENLSPRKLVEEISEEEKEKITDEEKLKKLAVRVLEENPEAVSDYKEGKKESLGFLIGQIMEKTQGKAEGEAAKKVIQEELKNF